jgi:hypothetical protein
MRLIGHFKIETVKPKTKVVPNCGAIIEGFPLVSADWVTVQVSHNCLSKTFVEFIETKLNPVLISKGYSILNATIIHDGEMSFGVEFAAKAITPHNLPIKGDESLFDLFEKNWNEVYSKHFTKPKAGLSATALEALMRKQKVEIKSLLKSGIGKEVSKALSPLGLRLASGVKISSVSANFMTTISTKENSVMTPIEKVAEVLKNLFGEKGVSIAFSYPNQDKNLPHIGYWIKIEYQTLKDYSEKNPPVQQLAAKPAPKKTQTKSAPAAIVKDTHKARKKRKKEMEKLIPVVKERVVPILKDSLGLLVHTFVTSGLSVSVMVKFSKKSLDKQWAPGKQKVVSAIEEVFGVGCVEVNDSKKKEVLVGYSVLFPYEKALEIFTGSVPPVVPVVQKVKPVKDELSDWASGIVVSALKQASEAQLLGEMYNRKHATAETIEKFISVCSSDSLIEELDKRVVGMKPEEKLKLIQLFSK